MVNWRKQPRLTESSDKDLARRVEESERTRKAQEARRGKPVGDLSGPVGDRERHQRVFGKDLPNEMPDR